MRNNPGPSTRHIRRMCETCKFLEDEQIKKPGAGCGHVIHVCRHKGRRNIPHCHWEAVVRLDDGKKCPLWNPIQSKIRGA